MLDILDSSGAPLQSRSWTSSQASHHLFSDHQGTTLLRTLCQTTLLHRSRFRSSDFLSAPDEAGPPRWQASRFLQPQSWQSRLMWGCGQGGWQDLRASSSHKSDKTWTSVAYTWCSQQWYGWNSSFCNLLGFEDWIYERRLPDKIEPKSQSQDKEGGSLLSLIVKPPWTFFPFRHLYRGDWHSLW